MDRLVGKTIRESQRQDSEETQTKQGKQIEIVTCPDCDTQSIIRDESHGERHCHECGLVVSENEIDHGPEWRAFNPSDQESKSRVGSPTRKSMHDKGLTTTIDWKNKDTFGRILSPKKRSQMLRLRKWQQRIRTKDSNERNLQFALSEIDRMASALGLSQQIRETASVIYRTALRNDLIRGRSIEGVTSASLYAACRQNSIPRSLSEISQVARVNRKEIGRTYRYVSSHIGLELEPVDPKNTCHVSVHGLRFRIVSSNKQMKLSMKQQKRDYYQGDHQLDSQQQQFTLLHSFVTKRKRKEKLQTFLT